MEERRPSTAPAISNATHPTISNRHLTSGVIPTVTSFLEEEMSVVSTSSSSCQQGAVVEYPGDDDGKPSTNVHRDLMRTLKLIREERHLVADELYQNVKRRMEELGVVMDMRRNGDSDTYGMGHEAAQNYVAARHVMDREMEEFEKLEHRALLLRRVKRNLTLHDDWTLSHETKTGPKTYYRRETNGSLSIKVEGELTETPIVEQIAVTRELDLYHHWAPFCTDSRILGELGRLDVVAWQKIGALGLERDSCFRAIGCDSLAEDGCIILSARSLSGGGTSDGGGGDASRPWPLPNVDGQEYNQYLDSYFDRYVSSKVPIEIPPEPTGFGAARMEVRNFECLVKVLDTNNSRVCMIGNIDPNISLLPQSLLEFLMKKMCARLLPDLQAAAMAAVDDPENSIHARRMRKDTRFYRDWCMPKVKHYCTKNSWDIPEAVKAFSSTEYGLYRDSTFDSDNASVNEIQSVSSAPAFMATTRATTGANTSPESSASIFRTRPSTSPDKNRKKKMSPKRSRANTSPENRIRKMPPIRSPDQLSRLRELKQLLHNSSTSPPLSDSVIKKSKTAYPRLDQLLFFSDQMLTTCNGIPQKFLFPALFIISAIVFPTNFDKHLECALPETYAASFKVTLSVVIIAVLALVFLITIQFIVINIALVSILNDIEMFANNGALANTRQLLVGNVRYGSLGVSVGIAALSILKSGIIFVSRILYHRILIISAEFANFWEPIKMLGADNRTVIAIVAEWIEIMARLPFILLSALLSPVLHHVGFLSRMMAGVLDDDADYFFWRNAVHGTQVGMMYFTIFILSCICLINKFFISNKEGEGEARKQPHFTLDEHGNIREETSHENHSLFKIEEDSSSAGTPVSSIHRRENKSVGDDVSTVTTKSKKKRKNIFKFKKKIKKKEKNVSFDALPGNITTNNSL